MKVIGHLVVGCVRLDLRPRHGALGESGLQATHLHQPFAPGGDGIKMGEAIGAKSIDLEWVQARWC